MSELIGAFGIAGMIIISIVLFVLAVLCLLMPYYVYRLKCTAIDIHKELKNVRSDLVHLREEQKKASNWLEYISGHNDTDAQ